MQMNLSALKDVSELKELSISPTFFRGEFLLGFGYEFDVTHSTFETLDLLFPETPVFFTRKDGHASIINSLAANRLNLKAGELHEADHMLAYQRLPRYTVQQRESLALAGQQHFLEKGFTHIRDMTMTEDDWRIVFSLSQRNDFFLAIESYLYVSERDSLSDWLSAAQRMKEAVNKNMRFRGIKIFYDGTLGASTAHVSCACSSTRKINWALEDLQEIMVQAWKNNFEVAIHTIGDQAVHEVVSLARKISASGVLGRLCLEHAELLRPETIQMLKPLHVEVHMQPCHFFSDRNLFHEKYKEAKKYLFQWNRLERAGVPLFFGSDSPIVEADFFKNIEAIEGAKQEFKIPKIENDIALYHTHPDKSWISAQTEINHSQITKVTIENQVRFQK